jgi:hypothetical protein
VDDEVIRRRMIGAAVAALICGPTVQAQADTTRQADSTQKNTETGLRGVLDRGARVMGVDQTKSAHEFDLLPDGARIRLLQAAAEPSDSGSVATIRRHLRSIARAFSRGDFTSPAIVHDRIVPGTKVMAAKRSLITYRVNDLPRGGEVWLITRDSTAMAAIREFVAFQRADHRAGGKDSTAHQMHHPKP